MDPAYHMSDIQPLGLAELTDQPTLSVAIGGKTYRFSELTLEGLGRLQAWINTHCVDPLESIKSGLEGFPPEDRQFLLNEARKDRKAWPPDVKTSAGKKALLGTDPGNGGEPGQIEALFEGLRVHWPSVTREQAHRMYRDLTKEAFQLAKAAKRAGKKFNGETTIQRIYATMFDLDMPDPDDEAIEFPKDLAPRTKESTGSYSTGGASKNCG